MNRYMFVAIMGVYDFSIEHVVMDMEKMPTSAQIIEIEEKLKNYYGHPRARIINIIELSGDEENSNDGKRSI